MKNPLLFIALLFLSRQISSAQTNCSNPLMVTVCPAVYLTNQTNAGMLNDATSGCNIVGEDLVYKISANLATQRIFVSIVNATASLRIYLETGGTCGSGSCTSKLVPSGNSNWTFNVAGYTTYYLWVDAATTITYNIGIGGDTMNTFVSIPNTQGNIAFESTVCNIPPFKSSKPYLQVKYNGVYKTDPMTLSPLNVTGSLCIITYFKNTTGIEGIKKFTFYYNPLGFSSFTPSPATLPGFYNAGTWVSSSGANRWTFTFNDSAATGKGDFTGTPNTCLRYEFCFDVVPISNDPVKTNIKDSAWTDGFGVGFSGTVRNGCCPTPFPTCLGASGGSASSSTHAFGTGIADPGTLLPIVLIQFDARASNGEVDVNWTTQSELNNDYFTVQKSADGTEWTSAAQLDGAGNSTTAQFYHYLDKKPFAGTSYYRLRQTDFDGSVSYSPVVSVKSKETRMLSAYPNPSHGKVTIVGLTYLFSPGETTVSVFNPFGERFRVPTSISEGEIELDLSALEPGIYLVQLDESSNRTYQKILLEK